MRTGNFLFKDVLTPDLAVLAPPWTDSSFPPVEVWLLSELLMFDDLYDVGRSGSLFRCRKEQERRCRQLRVYNYAEVMTFRLKPIGPLICF